MVDIEGTCVWFCICGDDGYLVLNLDISLEFGLGIEDSFLSTGVIVLFCGCVSVGGFVGLGGSFFDRLKLFFEDEVGWVLGSFWGGGRREVFDSEAGSFSVGLDMDTFDSGFAGFDCGSFVDCDFISFRDEGFFRSYFR